MPLTAAQIAAGHQVHQTLRHLEHATKAHHAALAELRDSFRDELEVDQFEAFGGGTPKDGDPGP